MEIIENKINPLEGLDKLITKGGYLLNGHDASKTHYKFNNWVNDVSKWLKKRFPDSGLSADWAAQGQSNLVTGSYYDESPVAWSFFKRTVEKRLRWLGDLPQMPKIKNLSAPALPQKEEESPMNLDRSKIFIVHGRDELAKTETARFVEKLGLSAIILHEQASSGKTIIEKIEEHTNVGFGIVLYTPCDQGGLDGKNLKSRARQNVVFEHGYLIAKLGRQNVCTLVKGDIETPNDISGIVYTPLDDNKAWQFLIAKELRNAGYNIDMNKI